MSFPSERTREYPRSHQTSPIYCIFITMSTLSHRPTVFSHQNDASNMSYFPPPPPAPPPALPPVPNHASDIRPSTLNGFRGGGSRGHQRRGCQAQTRYSARSHFAFPGCLSNAQRYDGGYGHNSNSRNGQRLGFKGLTDQLPESKDTVTANSSPKQPHQQPMHRGAIGPDGGSWRNAGRNPTNGEYTSSDYQQVASPIPELDANGGAATLKGHSMRIGREEQRTRIQSIKYSQNTQRDAQTGAHSLFTGFDGINGLFPSQFGPRSHSQVYGGRGRKRGYGEAFGRGRPAQSPPRGQAPPAVPSFGGPLPLPAKPAPRSGETKLDKTKKRKHNQLGLTPSTVEHDSSKDEDEDLDDQDEEIKLAAAAVNGAAAMQISYKGQTSTLQSPADIAAWIAERKRRFPTKARAAEAAEQRQQREQARRKAYLAQVERRNRQVKEPKENKRQKANEHAERRNARDAQKIRQRPEESEEAATKGKRKVEKLRRQLKKEEKRVAKAEAKAMERQRLVSTFYPPRFLCMLQKLSEAEALTSLL